MDTLELRGIEDTKIHCTREYFKAISGEKVAIRNIVNAAIAKFGISGKYASGKEI